MAKPRYIYLYRGLFLLHLQKKTIYMERFIIKPSELKPGYWVCTDTVNLINCTFENHNFNDNQEFKLLNDFDPEKHMDLARFAREMGDWLRENHYSKIF